MSFTTLSFTILVASKFVFYSHMYIIIKHVLYKYLTQSNLRNKKNFYRILNKYAAGKYSKWSIFLIASFVIFI